MTQPDTKTWELVAGVYTLKDLRQLNVVVGRNGCGKSSILKAAEQSRANSGGGIVRYVTPERGGALVYSPHLELQALTQHGWVRDQRRANQYADFKPQVMALFRLLEMRVLRGVEASYINSSQGTPTFESYIQMVNSLLDYIEIRRAESVFQVFDKKTQTEIPHTSISSGESEIISLAIECLTFASEVEAATQSILFIDEPDVHLHPDLQARFVTFLMRLCSEYGFSVIMATHSTAMLAPLASRQDAAVAFMQSGQTELSFTSVDTRLSSIIPVFGAHPLSAVFNDKKILLLEGDDDVRLWQQAIRSSQGQLTLFPVSCGGKGEMSKYETAVNSIAPAIYENPVAYSLQDRDGSGGEPESSGIVRKLRLGCRASENLLLSDESLTCAKADWHTVQQRLDAWLIGSEGHPYYEDLLRFKNEGYDRQSADLKSIRSILAAVGLALNKDWAVHVGQVVGKIANGEIAVVDSPSSVAAYLGPEVVRDLVGDSTPTAAV